MSRSIWQALSQYEPPEQAIALLRLILRDVQQTARRLGTRELDMFLVAKPLGVRPVRAEFSALQAQSHMPLRKTSRMYVLDVNKFAVWVERECARLARKPYQPAPHVYGKLQQGSMF